MIVGGTAHNLPIRNMVYDLTSLAWVAEQQTTVTVGSATIAVGDVITLNSLVPVAFDYLAMTYTGSDLTKAEYYTGGAGGTKVATLNMTYTSGVMQTVSRS